jgi:hypothetical protein
MQSFSNFLETSFSHCTDVKSTVMQLDVHGSFLLGVDLRIGERPYPIPCGFLLMFPLSRFQACKCAFAACLTCLRMVGVQIACVDHKLRESQEPAEESRRILPILAQTRPAGPSRIDSTRREDAMSLDLLHLIAPPRRLALQVSRFKYSFDSPPSTWEQPRRF